MDMQNLLFSLHERILHQQSNVEKLIALLLTSAMEQSGDAKNQTIQDLCKRHTALLGEKNYNPSDWLSLLTTDKESASAVFIKLSQLLLKWSELEWNLIKTQEMDSDENDEDTALPLSEEDMHILREYLNTTHVPIDDQDVN